MTSKKPADAQVDTRTPNDAETYDAVLGVPAAFRAELEQYIVTSPGPFVWKMQNFTKYVPRQVLTRFIARYEMFKRVLDIQGSIFECGVLGGGGLMAWAQLSAILEPLNYQRRLVGFDTFAGFADLSPEDATGESSVSFKGALALDSYADIMESARLYDANRFLPNLPKVSLVRGDMKDTIPKYLEANPETLVSLLYIDVDVFEPTRVALEQLVPRMPKGAILAFDELNDRGWPGETIALLQTIGVRSLRLQRFSFDTKISYAVLE